MCHCQRYALHATFQTSAILTGLRDVHELGAGFAAVGHQATAVGLEGTPSLLRRGDPSCWNPTAQVCKSTVQLHLTQTTVSPRVSPWRGAVRGHFICVVGLLWHYSALPPRTKRKVLNVSEAEDKAVCHGCQPHINATSAAQSAIRCTLACRQGSSSRCALAEPLLCLWASTCPAVWGRRASPCPRDMLARVRQGGRPDVRIIYRKY